MASKGPRSSLDHESRARRQKALESPKEPRRPKNHWDHVLEEMVWLSKDFQSERRWKLVQAKKVATRASKGMLDLATRGEKRVKEEEQRLRKIALNISKDIKKFWSKIEKLVMYKHQLELDENKKKALDKQLEFLLGQTERYSSMLAENLVHPEIPAYHSSSLQITREDTMDSKKCDENEQKTSNLNTGSLSNGHAADEDYFMGSSDETEDDERTLEEDEALITKEERDEELAALQREVDLPLEDLLKRYSTEVSIKKEEIDNAAEDIVDKCEGEHIDTRQQIVSENGSQSVDLGRRAIKSNGFLSTNHYSDADDKKSSPPTTKLVEFENHLLHEYNDEQGDDDFELPDGYENEGMDDETTILEEEQLAKNEADHCDDEILLLQKDSEIPLEELLAKYEKCPDSEMEECCEVSFSGESSSSLESDIGEDRLLNDDSSQFQQDTCCYSEEGDDVCIRKPGEETQGGSLIADAAVAARSAQPTGNTFLTTNVRTKFPFLLKYPLREYQHIGLDWLVTMYEKRLNGILADEMGLGKTIMTISLLAHLACEKGIWGPHLIVVPTSVMLNWETEFLKWCPAFKILTYFGSAKERRIKRQGWLKPNSFHVCVTTYRLVIQDAKVFKRKKWKYLILDEAHLIKNWKSQRWQTLLNFNSKRRILLTGTPLQNDLMELWSLMHFLMPHVFQSHQEFKEWFCNPISGMVEGQARVNKDVVDRLHNVLRPFILRRLKRDVEKQLPRKHEHIIYCRLSKRQRNLYEDFIASAETQATLASANFFGIFSIIMQLRKVCNHPDLFEGRPIVSSFDMKGIDLQLSSLVCSILSPRPFSTVNLGSLGLVFTQLDFTMASWEGEEIQGILSPIFMKECVNVVLKEGKCTGVESRKKSVTNIFAEIQKAISEERLKEAEERMAAISWWNTLRCKKKPLYATDLRELVKVRHPIHDISLQKDSMSYDYSSKLADVLLSPVERFKKMSDEVESFMFANPAARAPPPLCWCSKGGTPVYFSQCDKDYFFQSFSNLFTPFRSAIVRRQVYFPDRRLIQFDCGKLQELAVLLRRLRFEGHRALIFTQMTKMLDVLESFINLYGYTYMRLDGSTPPEERQTLMQQFNTNPKIFLFILSTRSGGVGINLVGADTVIFYDSDWNPAMDQQAQDRCHRIGQTREVHIYRLISESTIEENILKKANQKRALDDLVIQGGGYNTEFLKKLDPLELFSGHKTALNKAMPSDKKVDDYNGIALSNVDLEAALKNAEDEADYMALKKVEEEEAVDNQEFTEEAVGQIDDDELLNEEEMNLATPAEHSSLNTKSDLGLVVTGNYPIKEENAVSHVEEDVDMLVDVKQMAEAAAASGQAMLSFENQLRPIDQYAFRFLELWDPLIGNAAVESSTAIAEPEWELERIEKLKDEMEAEIDEDEEPLVYESWDADFATEVYKQQVDLLTQHQMKEDLEREAREKEALESANLDSPWNDVDVIPKPKSKKKGKKTKFKSLKKGNFVSKSTYTREDEYAEPMWMDDDIIYDEIMTSSSTLSPCSAQEKKRPTSDDDEHGSSRKLKRVRTSGLGQMAMHAKQYSRNHEDNLKLCDDGIDDLGYKYLNRNKTQGKLSISMVPPKILFTIKMEKLRKKGPFYCMDFSYDIWSPTEDAILCAIVHEYGPNWSLASDVLYGWAAGGSYRGRFHHPVQCSERFRDLTQRYILSSGDATHEKNVAGSGKTMLKVKEDDLRVLLGIASGMSDSEPLLQTHFLAVLSAARRAPLQPESCWTKVPHANKGQSDGKKFPVRLEFTNLRQCGKLVAAALNVHQANPPTANRSAIVCQNDTIGRKDQLDVVLEIQGEKDDDFLSLPSAVNVSIHGPDSDLPSTLLVGNENHLKSTRSQFRDASVPNVGYSLFGEESRIFAINEPKPQSEQSEKQKLPVHDSSRPCKLKSRRTSKDHSEVISPTSSEPFHQPSAAPTEPSIWFDESPSCISEAGASDIVNNSLLTMDGEISFWAFPGTTPFQFSPDLGTEFMDIG